MTKSEESTRGSKSSPDGSDLERGTISEKDREELAQLNRKIANLIIALKEAGYFNPYWTGVDDHLIPRLFDHLRR